MVTTVGLFRTPAAGARAVRRLRREVPGVRVKLLAPEEAARALETVPSDDAESPGMGTAVGGVVGGAVGIAAASLLAPPAGVLAVLTVTAGALLGATGGAAAGDVLEGSLSRGLPRDELFFYASALREGHIVAIVFADDDAQADRARDVLAAENAESVDAAREDWWLGLRQDEADAWRAEGHDFDTDEPRYRRGFEAALREGYSCPSDGDVDGWLASHHPDDHRDPAFSRGFRRGRVHLERRRQLLVTRPSVVDAPDASA